MFCSKCGKENNSENLYCCKCGTRLAQNNTHNNQQNQYAQPAKSYSDNPQTVKECLGKSWQEMKKNTNWVGKSLFTAFICLIPVLNFTVFGYFYNLAKHAAKNEQTPYPTTIVNTKNFKLGFFVFIIGFLFGLACWIFYLLSTNLLASNGFFIRILGAVLFLLLLAALVFLPLITSLMCLRTVLVNFAESWNFNKIFRELQGNFKNCFLMFSVSFLVCFAISAIVFFILSSIANAAFFATIPADIKPFLMQLLHGFGYQNSMLNTSANMYQYYSAILSSAVVVYIFFIILAIFCTSAVYCALSQVITRAEGYFVAKFIPEWINEKKVASDNQFTQQSQPQQDTSDSKSTTQSTSCATKAPTSETKPTSQPVSIPTSQPIPQPVPTPSPQPVPQSIPVPGAKPAKNTEILNSNLNDSIKSNSTDTESQNTPTFIKNAHPTSIKLIASETNKFVFSSFPITIGSNSEATLSIQGLETLDSTHCTIFQDSSGYICVTNNSSKGDTLVNGQQVVNSSILSNKDKLSLGGLELVVEII